MSAPFSARRTSRHRQWRPRDGRRRSCTLTTGAFTLSPAVAALVALLVLLGAMLALIGSVGLLRLRTFYERIHPPTMGTTLGVGFTLVASMLLFSVLESRPVVHEIVITVF